MLADKKAIEAYEKELVTLGVTGETPNLAKVLRDADKKMRKRRKQLLLHLANCPSHHRQKERVEELCKTLYARFEFDFEETSFLETVISDLRRIWSQNVIVARKQPTVEIYLQLAVSSGGIHAFLPYGYLSFNAKNFPGQLVIAILENWHRMVKCGNPECLAPYFLAKRSTQRYCQRGECTQYALRTKALKSWRKKHGKSTEGGEA